MLRIITAVFGAAFIVLGVLGFVPGLITEADGLKYLFNLFVVEILHQVLYIVSGVVALLAASSQRYSHWYLQIFGIAYAVIALAGLVQGDTVLGAFTVNTSSNALHVSLAVALLAAGFGLPTDGPSSKSAR
ncbi:MAG TPA: DUF4383 domain-containing protein [Candidatus Saccharimonadales bacterium]|nr:DUF4383 domain-containing protein [Candidatus Saccharimonadales bacterium]